MPIPTRLANDGWWLCESHYNSASNSLTTLERALERALFGIRRIEFP